ncbi:MAG: hypothetical protein IPL32_17860 [Chloracidobacterium sp.]|nr:hypothetical protein [Chloracidobacterium sp.]
MPYTPTDIITVFPGTYTPGAETSLNAMADVINAAWNKAGEKAYDYDAKIAAATTGWLDGASAPHITASTATAPTVTEPAVTIPSTVNVTDVMTLFDTKYLELVALLSDKFTYFRTTYFPNDSADYAAVDAWIQAGLADESGLPAAVRAQMLTDASDAIYADAARASDAVLQTFAAMRYPIPPGAAASAVLQIQQKAQDGVAEAGRKITVASVDQLRFVVEKAVGLRHEAMADGIAYIQALASGPDMASKLISTGYDAQSKLISSASQFYNARTEAARLTASVSQFNASATQEAATKNQVSDLTLIEDKLKALLSEAQALATMATSLYNNVHASAGTGYSVAA